MNIWRGLKTIISRAGTALNAVGLSPRFAWTLQLQFWRSNASPKRDSRGTTAFRLQRNPRLELDRPESINPPRRSRAFVQRKKAFPFNLLPNPRKKITLPNNSERAKLQHKLFQANSVCFVFHDRFEVIPREAGTRGAGAWQYGYEVLSDRSFQ